MESRSALRCVNGATRESSRDISVIFCCPCSKQAGGSDNRALSPIAERNTRESCPTGANLSGLTTLASECQGVFALYQTAPHTLDASVKNPAEGDWSSLRGITPGTPGKFSSQKFCAEAVFFSPFTVNFFLSCEVPLESFFPGCTQKLGQVHQGEPHT